MLKKLQIASKNVREAVACKKKKGLATYCPFMCVCVCGGVHACVDLCEFAFFFIMHLTIIINCTCSFGKVVRQMCSFYSKSVD